MLKDDLSNAEKAISENLDFSIFINFNEFHALELLIKEFSVMLESVCGELSMTCFFDEGDVCSANAKPFAECSHRWSEAVASHLNAATYYCGLEPAEDEKTRFFTEKRLGPL